MIVGVTGTSRGATIEQMRQIRRFFDERRVKILHHGDCIGVDVQTAKIAEFMGIDTVCHPPINPRARARHNSTVILPEKDYLVRNKDIVDSSDHMIVVPFEKEEILRSGTWMTYRYAKKKDVSRTIIFPDGELRTEKSNMNDVYES